MRIYIVNIGMSGKYYSKGNFEIGKENAQLLTWDEAEKIQNIIKRKYNLDCIIESK